MKFFFLLILFSSGLTKAAGNFLEISKHPNSVSSHFSPDGKQVILQTIDSVDSFDAQTGVHQFAFESDNQPAFHSHGSNFCGEYFVGPGLKILNEGGAVRLYDLKTGRFLKKFQSSLYGADGFYQAVSFSRDCSKLMVSGVVSVSSGGQWPGFTTVWDVPTGQELFSTNVHGAGVMNKEGTQLVLFEYAGEEFYLYSVSGALLYHYEDEDLDLTDVTFSEDSSKLIFGGGWYELKKGQGLLGTFDIQQQVFSTPVILEGHLRVITPLRLRPDNIYVSTDLGLVYRFDLLTRQLIKNDNHYNGKKNNFDSLSVSADGQILAACDYFGKATLWSVQNNSLLFEIDASPGMAGMNRCSLSPTGDQLAFSFQKIGTRVYPTN